MGRVLVRPRPPQIVPAQRASIVWSARNAAAEQPQIAPLSVVCVGDSITYGSQSTSPGGATSYPGVLATALGLELGDTVRNLGVSGLSSFDLPDPDYLLRSGYDNKLVVMIGLNDIFVGSQSAEDVFARLDAYVESRAAKGWSVTVCTLTGHNSNDDELQAKAEAYNDLIREAGYASVVDVAADPNIGHDAETGSEYYSLDQVHLSDTGYAHLASLVAPVVQASAPGVEPVIEIADGIERSADLKLWTRDWNTVTVTTSAVADLQSLTNPRAFPDAPANTGYPALGGTSDPVLRVLNQLNGHRILRFPGDAVDALSFYQVGGRTLANFISASSFYARVLIKPAAIDANNTTHPQFNHGLICDSTGYFGIFLRKAADDDYRVVAFVRDGSTSSDYNTVEAAIELDEWVDVTIRLVGGVLGLRLGTQGAWIELPGVGDVHILTGTFRIGKSPGNRCYAGDLAEVIVRDAYDAEKDAADGAYIRARYGGTL